MSPFSKDWKPSEASAAKLARDSHNRKIGERTTARRVRNMASTDPNVAANAKGTIYGLTSATTKAGKGNSRV